MRLVHPHKLVIGVIKLCLGDKLCVMPLKLLTARKTGLLGFASGLKRLQIWNLCCLNNTEEVNIVTCCISTLEYGNRVWNGMICFCLSVVLCCIFDVFYLWKRHCYHFHFPNPAYLVDFQLPAAFYCSSVGMFVQALGCLKPSPHSASFSGRLMMLLITLQASSKGSFTNQCTHLLWGDVWQTVQAYLGHFIV